MHLGQKISNDDMTALIQWIIDNRAAYNIQFVACTGDLCNTGSDVALPYWQPLIVAGIPVTLAPGNHDYDTVNDTRDVTGWNASFGAGFYAGQAEFGSTFEADLGEGAGVLPGGTVNHYFLLTIAGVDYLVLSLEMGPRDKVMDWAENLVLNVYPTRKVIIFTHSYLHLSGARVTVGTDFNPQDYTAFSTEAGPEYTNSGEDMWTKYLTNWGNLLAVFSGHATDAPYQHHLRSLDSGGNTVWQFFFNCQNWGYLTQPTYNIADEKAAVLRLIAIDGDNQVAYSRNYWPTVPAWSGASTYQMDWSTD